MDQSLVDKEGFPRGDVNIHAVRISRSRVLHLQNDHKAVMTYGAVVSTLNLSYQLLKAIMMSIE
jgi:hypothetical protein